MQSLKPKATEKKTGSKQKGIFRAIRVKAKCTRGGMDVEDTWA